MSYICIEKFVEGKMEQHFRVPAMIVSTLALLLPASALDGLRTHGIDIQGILQAYKAGMPYSVSFDVTEDGAKKIVHILVIS